jgi:hypothetical protein
MPKTGDTWPTSIATWSVIALRRWTLVMMAEVEAVDLESENVPSSDALGRGFPYHPLAATPPVSRQDGCR